ncbi:MAG: SGNH/GDSL hydrolase family protein [Bacteroidales bacterium]|nr:SGNH/GDSL hydrolase family protein [Bacteroidales bacterium]
MTKGTQWEGKKVGILGDSMSDPRLGVTTKRFYDYLADLIGIEPYSYAINGYQWKDLLGKATAMKQEHPDDLDAIFIWAGTNDFNSSRPIGGFFTETIEEVNVNGRMEKRNKRTHILDEATLSGSINRLLSYLKSNFPTSQIIILTPIHRAFAKFGDTNVQPSEEYANGAGLYLDDYIKAIRKAGEIWSVPVIDLYSISGLYPLDKSNDRYIADPDTDRLHPGDEGHYRLARTLQFQLQTLPPSFRVP